MKLSSLIAAATLITAPVVADDAPAPSGYDRVWDSLKLIDHQDADLLQSLAVVGRLQGDWVNFDGGSDGKYSNAIWRRFRIGGKAVLFNDFVAHAEVDLDLNEWGSNESYNRLTDGYVGWNPSDTFNTKIGKQSAGFTLDGATSSKNLLAMERSTVADNIWFPTEYFTGATGFGKKSGWTYNAGAFSASGDPELGYFDSGWFSLLSLGRDLTEQLNLRLDYVYNDPNFTGDVGTRNLQHIVSAVAKYEAGRAGLWTDLSFADGISEQDQSNLIGLQLMPFWNFSKIWQGVFRYTLVHSMDEPGAQLGHYPTKVVGQPVRYETVQDFYLGLNCFLYGHKLKWQSGVEYDLGLGDSISGGDYHGWGASTGIRISW